MTVLRLLYDQTLKGSYEFTKHVRADRRHGVVLELGRLS